MAREKKQATTAEVRQWAKDNEWVDDQKRPVAERGRMPSGLVTEFNQAMKRHNIEYTNGGRVVGEQSGTRAASSTPAPRKNAEKATSPSKAVATRSTASTTPAPRQESQATVVTSDAPDGIAALMNLLTTAAANGRKGGQPILFQASTLVNV